MLVNHRGLPETHMRRACEWHCTMHSTKSGPVRICLCSMFLKQFGRYFSAVGAAGFPQCWQCVWTGGLNEEGIGPPDLYIPEL